MVATIEVVPWRATVEVIRSSARSFAFHHVVAARAVDVQIDKPGDDGQASGDIIGCAGRNADFVAMADARRSGSPRR